MASTPNRSISIDGKQYDLDALNDETKQLLGSIRAVDAEILRLRRQLAIAQTARAAYARSVSGQLRQDGGATGPSDDVTPAEATNEADA